MPKLGANPVKSEVGPISKPCCVNKACTSEGLTALG